MLPAAPRAGGAAWGRRRTDRHPLGGPVLTLPYGDDGPSRRSAPALASVVEGLAGDGVEVLSGRCIPGGGAVEHLVVAASGVYVVETQPGIGMVAKQDVGGWFRRDVRLYVGRRDCTSLVEAARTRADAVAAAVDGVPVTAVLCFPEAEFGLLAKPVVVRGVHAASPKATTHLVRRPGPLGADRVAAIASAASAAFPPSAA